VRGHVVSSISELLLALISLFIIRYIPIERGDAASRERCMESCREWIQKGSSVVFFPEGTRSPDGVLRPFKTGAFRLALETGAQILPIVIRGSGNAVPKHSILLTRKTRMSVEVLSPISLQDFSSQPQDRAAQFLADFAFEQIQTALRSSPTGSISAEKPLHMLETSL